MANISSRPENQWFSTLIRPEIPGTALLGNPVSCCPRFFFSNGFGAPGNLDTACRVKCAPLADEARGTCIFYTPTSGLVNIRHVRRRARQSAEETAHLVVFGQSVVHDGHSPLARRALLRKGGSKLSHPCCSRSGFRHVWADRLKSWPVGFPFVIACISHHEARRSA